MDVVESVNVHDDIKVGLPTRDMYIDNYIQTMRNLKEFGVKVILLQLHACPLTGPALTCSILCPTAPPAPVL